MVMRRRSDRNLVSTPIPPLHLIERGGMTVADEAGSRNIRIWDLKRRNWTVLTEESSVPVWTLDARRIVFSSGRNGRFNHLYMQRADDIGKARRLSRDDGVSTGGGSEQSPRAQIGWYPTSVSSDGRWLFLVEMAQECSRHIAA